MRALRRWHTYLGCFFAPLLLFFVLTGWYQMVKRDRLKSPGDAESVLQHLQTVHVNQIYPTNTERTHPSSPKLFETLVIVMAVALTVTVVLGVILAFRSTKKLWPVYVSLILGFLVPVLFLWLGRR